MATFCIDAPCPFCDGKKIEIQMSPSAYRIPRAECIKCHKTWEY